MVQNHATTDRPGWFSIQLWVQRSPDRPWELWSETQLIDDEARCEAIEHLGMLGSDLHVYHSVLIVLQDGNFISMEWLRASEVRSYARY